MKNHFTIIPVSRKEFMLYTTMWCIDDRGELAPTVTYERSFCTEKEAEREGNKLILLAGA